MLNPFSGIKHAIGVVGSLTVMKGLGNWLAGEGLSRGAEFAKERIEKRFEERRDEFWAWVLTKFKARYPEAAKTLRRRRRERKLWIENGFSPNAEDNMVNTLTDLWAHMDEAAELEWRFVVFKELADLSDDNFADALDAFNNDGVKQQVLMVVYGIRQTTEWLEGLASTVDRRLVEPAIIPLLKKRAGFDPNADVSRSDLLIALLIKERESWKNHLDKPDEAAERLLKKWWLAPFNWGN